ncbi:MAG: methyl-accepting chemotaxis protein, partial [Myxococcota bacterium]
MSRSFANRSLRTRLVILFVLLLTMSSSFILLYFPLKMNAQAQSWSERESREMASLLVGPATAGLDFDDVTFTAEQLANLGAAEDAVYAVVERADGTHLAEWGEVSRQLDEAQLLHLRLPLESINGVRGALIIGFSQERLQAENRANLRTALIAFLLIQAVGLVATFMFSGVLVRSIQQLTRTAEQLAAGTLDLSRLNLNHPPDWSTSHDEARRLTHAINQIFSKVIQQIAVIEEERERARQAEKSAL